MEEINYMFAPVPSQHLDIQRHMSWLLFFFTFLIPYGRNKLYVCTCTEPAPGYPTPYVLVF